MDIPGIDYPRRHDDERRQEEIQALEDRIRELEDSDEKLRDLARRVERDPCFPLHLRELATEALAE